MAERTVVVTGASSGIGTACALHLDALGLRVIATVRTVHAGNALRERASARLESLTLDVTDEQAIADAADAIARRVAGGGLHGLVNNAGVAEWEALEHTPVTRLRELMEVNVIGVHAVTSALSGPLREGRGRIVNIGSVSGVCVFPFLGAYSASKFALEALTDAMRVEYAGSGIRVSLVQAGRIDTPIWHKAARCHDARREAVALAGQHEAALRQRRGSLERGGGLPAQRVAEVVAQALTAQRPRTRYRVGRDAWRGVALSWLPDRCRDWFMRRAIDAAGAGRSP